MTYTSKGATLSPDDVYRYKLWRQWAPGHRALFIMLNPSTADAELDDPTIRRCVSFAKALRCGSLDVVNLFAFRATDPKELATAADPVGPDNDGTILTTIRQAHVVVAAWGAHKAAKHRAMRVNAITRREGRMLYALGTTKAGAPRHPLYLPAQAADRLEQWGGVGAGEIGAGGLLR